LQTGQKENTLKKINLATCGVSQINGWKSVSLQNTFSDKPCWRERGVTVCSRTGSPRRRHCSASLSLGQLEPEATARNLGWWGATCPYIL